MNGGRNHNRNRGDDDAQIARNDLIDGHEQAFRRRAR